MELFLFLAQPINQGILITYCGMDRNPLGNWQLAESIVKSLDLICDIYREPLHIEKMLHVLLHLLIRFKQCAYSKN